MDNTWCIPKHSTLLEVLCVVGDSAGGPNDLLAYKGVLCKFLTLFVFPIIITIVIDS